MNCRHCGKPPPLRARQLCYACYHDPLITAQYPTVSKYARRGIVNFSGKAHLPEPTAALPGTPEKLAVLEERAVRGEALFHPADAMRRERPGRRA